MNATHTEVEQLAKSIAVAINEAYSTGSSIAACQVSENEDPASGCLCTVPGAVYNEGWINFNQW